MNQVSWADEPRCRQRFAAGLATDATTTGFAEHFVPASGSVGARDVRPDWNRLRLRDRIREQILWCLVLRAHNELTQPTEVQTADLEYDVPDNEATTVTFSARLRNLVLGKAAEPEKETPLLRGTVPIQHERGVIFTDEVELHIAELPAWKPRVAIGRRTLELGDE